MPMTRWKVTTTRIASPAGTGRAARRPTGWIGSGCTRASCIRSPAAPAPDAVAHPRRPAGVGPRRRRDRRPGARRTRRPRATTSDPGPEQAVEQVAAGDAARRAAGVDAVAPGLVIVTVTDANGARQSLGRLRAAQRRDPDQRTGRRGRDRPRSSRPRTVRRWTRRWSAATTRPTSCCSRSTRPVQAVPLSRTRRCAPATACGSSARTRRARRARGSAAASSRRPIRSWPNAAGPMTSGLLETGRARTRRGRRAARSSTERARWRDRARAVRRATRARTQFRSTLAIAIADELRDERLRRARRAAASRAPTARPARSSPTSRPTAPRPRPGSLPGDIVARGRRPRGARTSPN